MLNVVSKTISIFACVVCVTCNINCSSETANGHKDVDAANLYVKAENAINSGQYQQAITLIDSIDRTYPQAIEIRRKAMRIKPLAIEELAKKEYSITDSMIVVLQHRYDSLVVAFNQGKATSTQYTDVAKELRSWQYKMKEINNKLTVARNQQVRLNDTISYGH